ncbi:NUDIX domain-containing protein [Pigmentiphaga litoralis]|uniref:Putative NUDIX family NTP pyrophosphohydrolase n=1 Tax=Pigmentiphaga litoralis TaxID=516702 RepID=A0A7Y9IVZ2_9BURK|nr:NUDIX domain-containing protein [Pigmentiphaga litoralis]NYE22299.1 putative NUDIX family NTP pyrophosphohydrolase [Pigmentiphaga litoralis]NYE84086.1 putative NUDIX family NTP pyrophosphohydrolase [Pigmentiphaga litoralis]
MAITSAGILMYHVRDGRLEVLLVHPGGPFWRNKDAGAWSIPKGEVDEGEDDAAAARREFHEELGTRPEGDLIPLGEVRQRSGKRVRAFALEGDLDAAAAHSMTFEMEWPPRSGRMASFPEVDRAAWFDLDAARGKLIAGQVPLLDRLADHLQAPRPDEQAE